VVCSPSVNCKWALFCFINNTSSNVLIIRNTKYVHTLLQINISHCKLNTSPVNISIRNTEASAVHRVRWPLRFNAIQLRWVAVKLLLQVVLSSSLLVGLLCVSSYGVHVPTLCSGQERFSSTALFVQSHFLAPVQTIIFAASSFSFFCSCKNNSRCMFCSIALAVGSCLSLQHSVRPWRSRW
jgi:hypothetical protein